MKKSILLILFCFVIGLASGCSVDYNAIYQDDTKIIKSSDSHLSIMSVYNRTNNKFTMSARSFIGAKTIWNYNAKNDGEVTFLYSLSVSGGGDAKLVLITPNDEIIILAENVDNTETDVMQSQTVTLPKGKSRIKIVGQEDPKLNLVLSVDVGELVNK